MSMICTRARISESSVYPGNQLRRRADDFGGAANIPSVSRPAKGQEDQQQHPQRDRDAQAEQGAAGEAVLGGAEVGHRVVVVGGAYRDAAS